MKSDIVSGGTELQSLCSGSAAGLLFAHRQITHPRPFDLDPATFTSGHKRLAANVWPFDLNIEFHETIKQWCFSV